MAIAMRDRILDAAVTVLRDSGESGATTKEIARVAGCSEGSLYTHFANKEALLVAVLAERLPPFIPMLKALLERAGEGALPDHLQEVARVAVPFYVELMPLFATMLATPGLRENLQQQGFGPQRGNEALATYLRLEQRLGRIHAGVNLAAAAALLLGACQQRAMHLQFQGQPPDAEADSRFAADLIATLMRGMEPDS